MVDVLRPSPFASAPIDILDAPSFNSITAFTTNSGMTSLAVEQRQNAIKISITGCERGLGIRIVDAINVIKQACGIFVKEIIVGSLAERDGQLRVGDQLLEVNGINLIGVSRESCRKIMERCTATNQLNLLVARDHKSREDFHRLSVSLGNVIEPSLAELNVKSQSTPGLTTEMLADMQRFSALSSLTTDTTRKSNCSNVSSTSLTQVSDMSDEPKIVVQATATGSSHASVKDAASGQASATDVILEVPLDGKEDKTVQSLFSPMPPLKHVSQSLSSDESPPPLPSSDPPLLDNDNNFNSKFEPEQLIMPKKRVPTSAETAMAGVGSTIAALASKHSMGVSKESETIETVTITKRSALGITIRGGTNKPEGPHVYIDRIIPGLDVANDGTLKSGDRLVTVNGESMEGITKEHAIRILTQFKLKENTKQYQIVYGRKDKEMLPVTTSTPASKTHPVTPSTIGQPTTVYDSTIFNSATDSSVKPAINESTTATVSDFTVTLTSRTSEMGTAETMLLPVPSDEVDWESRGENDVVMRGKMEKQESYKRLTVDPRKKISFHKLILAMEYMGRKISEDEQQQMQQSLGIGEGGKVAFQDFAELVKVMFKFKLDMSMMEPTLLTGGVQRRDSMELPPLRKSSSSGWTSSDMSRYSQKEDSPKKDHDLELERMRQRLHLEGQRREEHLRHLQQQQQPNMLLNQDAISQEAVLRMQAALKEKEQYCRQLELQVDHFRKQAEIAEMEVQSKKKLEENIQNKLLLQYSKLPKDVEELRRRLAVLDCEWRKEQSTSRRYQVTTESLIQMAESVQEALAGSETGAILYHPRGTPARRGDPVAGNPRPPHYLSKHSRHTNETLTNDVKETLNAVKKMLDHQPLPHGWEESYTDDGLKFYINHQKQITSWVNPVTQISAGANQGSQTSSRAPSRTSSHTSITTPPRQ